MLIVTLKKIYTFFMWQADIGKQLCCLLQGSKYKGGTLIDFQIIFPTPRLYLDPRLFIFDNCSEKQYFPRVGTSFVLLHFLLKKQQKYQKDLITFLRKSDNDSTLSNSSSPPQFIQTSRLLIVRYSDRLPFIDTPLYFDP